MQDIKSKIKAIEDDISKNKLRDALTAMRMIFSDCGASEEKNQCLQQINHFNRLQKDITDGVITTENRSVQTAKIVKATLGLLSAAERLLSEPKEQTKTTDWRTADYSDYAKPVEDIFEKFKKDWNINKQEATTTPYGLTQTLNEQFIDNRNNWQVGPVHNFYSQHVGNIAIANNQCSITSNSNGSIDARIPFNINNFKEFAIETQVRFQMGDNFGFGLIWGINPTNFNSYYFLISQVGQFCIGYQMNGVSHNLANWMYSPYIWQGVNVNKLKAHRQGDQVYFYINDQHVFTTTYYQFFGNYLGMTAINYKTVSFDYLRVWN